MLLHCAMVATLEGALREEDASLEAERVLLRRTPEDRLACSCTGVVEFNAIAAADMLARSTPRRWIGNISIWRYTDLPAVDGRLR